MPSPVTTTGTLSINAPTCTGTNKLTWNGSAFVCAADQNSGGTITGVTTGPASGLSGGGTSGTLALAVNAPTCGTLERLTWNGAAFECVATPTDISARVCHTGVFTVADSTNTAVPFDTERSDTDNIHDTVTNNTRLTATTPGRYLIFGHITWVGTTGGVRQVGIYKNGDPIAIQNQPGSASGFSISTHHQLAQGDYVELFVLQNSGGSVGIPDGCPPNPQNYTNDFGMVKLP